MSAPPTRTQDALWRSLVAEIPDINHPEVPQKGNKTLFHEDLLPALDQPRVRNIAWNPKFRGDRSHVNKHPQNILAAVTYITGKEAGEPCSKCQRGSGPFIGCILPPDSLWESTSHKACANCIYGWQKKKCSYYPVADQPDLPEDESPQNRDWIVNPGFSQASDNIAFSAASLANNAPTDLGVVNRSRMALSTSVVAPGDKVTLDAGNRIFHLGIVQKGAVMVGMEHSGAEEKVETGGVFRPNCGRTRCIVGNSSTEDAQVLVLTLEGTGR